MNYDIILPGGAGQSLRSRYPLVSVEKMEQVQALLGEDVVNIQVKSEIPMEFEILSKVVVFGKTYRLNQIPELDKISNGYYTYDLVFEGTQYELRDAVYFNTDVQGFNTTADFPLTGDIELFVDVIINNMNRITNGKWMKGVVPTGGEHKTITIAEANCLAALQQICQEFGEEFEIVQGGSDTRVLHIRKNGEVLGHTYEYGPGKGLYKLNRKKKNDADVVTRLYPLGSTRNLKAGYRDFSRRLMIDSPGYIQDPAKVAQYGLKEAIVVYEDIYPSRLGAITSVTTPFSFVDASMNFDLNEKVGGNSLYLVPDNPAKVHFNTGNLAGFEFQITNYNHLTKTFTIQQMPDERGYKMPSETDLAFQMQPGDRYVILDINLPQSYVDEAENKLAARAQFDYETASVPAVLYGLEIDEKFLFDLYGDTEYYNVYSIGDYIGILDTPLGIDKASRIIKFTRNCLRPYQYTLDLADTYQITRAIEIIKDTNEIKNIIKLGRINDVNKLRMGWLNAMEVLRMVFDPDGYFDGGKIKPLTVETLALAVGAKSQQFVLQDVIFQPGYEGNTNVVAVSSGYLIHYAISDVIKTWSLEETIVTFPDNAARYIYAKVLKNSDTGMIVFSQDEILPDADPNYYHFWVGILHSAIDGVRGISLTYGMTTINGRFIKTGRVQDLSGTTYFDLDEGVIAGYIKFRDSAGNYRDLSDIGADMEGFYKATVVNPPDTYPSGKVTAYFTAINPSTWPDEEDSMHIGDVWYNPNTMTVRRYVGGLSWVVDSEPSVEKAYLSTYVRVGNNKTIQVFTAQPVAPYGLNDLWMSEEGLRRSIAEKVTGQPFDINDWVEPFNFDNTQTAIDAGILTSGIIQLAGDNNSVLAGISGRGTSDSSIRFWAGASFINRNTAPFRVDQAGRLTARTRIEVEGLDVDGETYVGQAGLAGQITEADGPIRIYAGRPYADRNTAPFRVNKNGFAWLEQAQIGNMRITGGGLANVVNQPGVGDTFYGDASITLANPTKNLYAAMGTNVAPETTGITILARFENNEVNLDPGHVKVAASFKASGGGPGSMQYAIHAPSGISMLGEALIMGRKSIAINPGGGMIFDPGQYDVIVIMNASQTPTIQIKTTSVYNTLYVGKEITLIGTNAQNGYVIWNTVHNAPQLVQNGGVIVTLIWTGSWWLVKSKFDNDF